MKKNGEGGNSSRLVQQTQARQTEPGNASRRRFVLGSAGYAISLGAGLGLAGCGGSHDEAQQRFGYGVASGDPLSDRVILWTRVNVSSPTDVQWEVATDTFFTKVVAAGTASTSDARDFTVKVDATGLQPGTTYFYRFHNGGETSATGRTKTLPAGAPGGLFLRRLCARPVPCLCGRGESRRLRCRADAGRLHLRNRIEQCRAAGGLPHRPRNRPAGRASHVVRVPAALCALPHGCRLARAARDHAGDR